MTKKNADKSKFASLFHTIRFKINSAVIIAGIILTLISLWLLSHSMQLIECELMDNRLKSDIEYLRDELTHSGDGSWSLKDGALYIDDVLIGDGTLENANLSTFKHCEEITGTFFYTFVRTYNDDELSWVSNGEYMQGHYLRVAGTTLGPRGERLEGTYIDKKVADVLESSDDGTYSGEANVNGRPIYCRYELLKDAEGENIGIIVDGRSVAEMKSIVRNQSISSFIITVFAFALVYSVLSFIAYKMLRSINRINERLKEIGTGNFPETPLELNARDEFDDIADSINEMADSLHEKERIESELNEKNYDLQIAADIQSSMLPGESCQSESFSVFASMLPAKEVGGDFYDHYLIDENHLAFVVADVSGKGTPAALFMMRAISTIRNFAQTGLPIEEVFNRANESLCKNNEKKYFVTAWMGILDLNDGHLNFVNAGHNSPVLRTADGEVSMIKSQTNVLLGAIDGISYKSCTMKLSANDSVFLYTDGITEAKDTEGRMFKEVRLLETVSAAPGTSDGICKAMLSAVLNFAAGAEQFDDITMLAVQYTKEAELYEQ